jgi:ArsR family transcriptional regulator
MNRSLQPERCAQLLRALADPERLRIIDCLRGGPRNVSDIAAAVGSGLVNVSHHLGVLRHAGIVADEKHGRYVVYRLHPDVFRGGYIDLGCCRLELPGEKNKPATDSHG